MSLSLRSPAAELFEQPDEKVSSASLSSSFVIARSVFGDEAISVKLLLVILSKAKNLLFLFEDTRFLSRPVPGARPFGPAIARSSIFAVLQKLSVAALLRITGHPGQPNRHASTPAQSLSRCAGFLCHSRSAPTGNALSALSPGSGSSLFRAALSRCL